MTSTNRVDLTVDEARALIAATGALNDGALESARAKIEALIPPPRPVYEDGTFAKVTSRSGRTFTCERVNGKWHYNSGRDGYLLPDAVDSVEVLRVAKANEVILRARPVTEHGTYWERACRTLQGRGDATAAEVISEYTTACKKQPAKVLPW